RRLRVASRQVVNRPKAATQLSTAMRARDLLGWLPTQFLDSQVDRGRQIHIRAGGPCVVKTTAEQLPQLGSRVGHQSRVDRFKRQAKRAARLGDRAAEPGTRVRVAARERNGGGCGEAPRESVCVSDRAAEPEALAQLRRRGFGLAAVQVDHREVSEAARYPVRVADG